MATLRILVADDQIPPPDVPEAQFRSKLLLDFGDTKETHAFFEQCVFMGQVVQALRDSGYRVTTARTYGEATKVISEEAFDLAIVDLGWYMDSSVPKNERPSAGWSLCEQLDERAAKLGTRLPQILFSSRFPTQPELSREAAKHQKLPLFKQATPVVLNSLLAAVGFVEATLAAQRSEDATAPGRFKRELQDVAVGYFKETMADYRRWALLALSFVAVSLISVLAGVAMAFNGALAFATLSSVTSMLCTAIAALLYKRLDSAQKAVESTRHEVMKALDRQ
jgi:hypothetical protein